MTTTNYINSNGLGLKVTQLPSELWLTPKEPLESILKVSMSLILSLN